MNLRRGTESPQGMGFTFIPKAVTENLVLGGAVEEGSIWKRGRETEREHSGVSVGVSCLKRRKTA